MADFDLAIPIVLEHEGGYANDVADPGGETNFGISKRSYPNLNIHALTVGDAKAIYRRDYWDYDAINDQALATKVFDLAVNMGTHTAVKLLQRAVNQCTKGVGGMLTMDGVFGPATLAACNAVAPEALLSELKVQAVTHYRFLVLSNPALGKFLPGWEIRAKS